jgi:peroxiredoxin
LVACFLAVGCTQSQPSASQQAASPAPAAEREHVDPQVRVARAEAPLERAPQAEPAPPAEQQPQPAANEADPSAAPAPASEAAPSISPAGPAPPTAVKAFVPLGELPDDQLTMPRVSFSRAHAQLCKVQVGDQFPNVELAKLDGKSQPFAELLGPKLTVVVLWNGKKPTSLQELGDLEPEVIARFGEQGVRIVAINSGDDPQLAGELAAQAGSGFVVLCDQAGTTLEQLAPGRVPSTYLLDPSGRVLWFDIEYSASTRRELVQAIRYTLAHPVP